MGSNLEDNVKCQFTGAEFNKKFSNYEFVTLTNANETLDDFKFSDGLNIDTLPFSTSAPWCGMCRVGGLYFTDIDRLPKLLGYNAGNPMVYVRMVRVPDDAIVYIELNKIKADKLFLTERKQISELDIWQNDKYCANAIKQHPNSLKFIVNQTNKLCLEAVKRDGNALEFVKIQTDEICLEAVKQNSDALEFVKKQSYELCLEAIKRTSKAL